MIHTFHVTYSINGVPSDRSEMTYSDADIIATLNRRLRTAFPNATNIQITRKPEDQLSLTPDKPGRR